jgi:hypothetical protein
MVAGTLGGLRAAMGHDLIVKLDTDALVVGPFVDELNSAMQRSPRAGVFGSYDRVCNGAVRDFTVWRRPVRRLTRRVLLRRASPFVEIVAPGDRRRRAGVLDAARANGYVDGEHCLGGAYAVRGELVRELDARGWLDARPWRRTWLGEDIVLGLLARACGYTLEGLVGPGEPFAVARAGLPAPPEELLSSGHSIVHSLKNDAGRSEAEVREYFRTQRAR